MLVRDLITLDGMRLGDVEEILFYYDEPDLSGIHVAHLFYEPSTRTRLSFDKAVRECGGYSYIVDESTSSAMKGESLEDTLTTLAALGMDAVVLRHGEDVSGVPHDIPIINAGIYGSGHPTQALVDVYTMYQNLRTLPHKKVAIVGETLSNRVLRSLVPLLRQCAVEVKFYGPSRRDFESLDACADWADVIYCVRVQEERGVVRQDDYFEKYGVLQHHTKSCLVMHPGPVNIGVEISREAVDNSLIAEQVRNGIHVRKRVLGYVLDRL